MPNGGFPLFCLGPSNMRTRANTHRMENRVKPAPLDRFQLPILLPAKRVAIAHIPTEASAPLATVQNQRMEQVADAELEPECLRQAPGGARPVGQVTLQLRVTTSVRPVNPELLVRITKRQPVSHALKGLFLQGYALPPLSASTFDLVIQGTDACHCPDSQRFIAGVCTEFIVSRDSLESVLKCSNGQCSECTDISLDDTKYTHCWTCSARQYFDGTRCRVCFGILSSDGRQCDPCPDNQTFDSDSGNCSPRPNHCPNGEYLDFSSGNCTPCSGVVSSDGTKCDPCASGTYYDNVSHVCSSCPKVAFCLAMSATDPIVSGNILVKRSYGLYGLSRGSNL